MEPENTTPRRRRIVGAVLSAGIGPTVYSAAPVYPVATVYPAATLRAVVITRRTFATISTLAPLFTAATFFLIKLCSTFLTLGVVLRTCHQLDS
jgi:hypothetical protein